jgi:hypothetical protein
MFTLGSSQKYYLYTFAADMRNGINGLSGLVNSIQQRRGNQEEVYVFINRHKNIMKLLYYEHGGQSIFYKRLEQGCYEHSTSVPSFTEIKWSNLVLIVEGIIIVKSKQKQRYLSDISIDKKPLE